MGERFTSRDLGDELMIHDSVTDSVHVLSKAAGIIFNEYRAGKTVDDIVESMRKAFKVPAGQDLRGDVDRCLAELRTKGLVE